MEKREARDLIISAVVLAFVFSYEGMGKINLVLNNFLVAIVAVSLGFILHELSHRFVARRTKCHAEYRLWPQGLLLAVALAIITNGAFTFAAPGAVMIQPLVDLWGHRERVTKKDVGMISISGPIMNTILAVIFTIIGFFVFNDIMRMAAGINLWLGLFNMIPVPPLDGFKVFAWDKKIWFGLFIFLILLFFFV